MSTTKSIGPGDFVSGWDEIGEVLGVSGKKIRRAVSAGNRTLKKAIRNTNPGGQRVRPIALRSALIAIRNEVFPSL